MNKTQSWANRHVNNDMDENTTHVILKELKKQICVFFHYSSTFFFFQSSSCVIWDHYHPIRDPPNISFFV